MSISDKGLILREQPDKVSIQVHIADLLDKLARLYQIPNWDQLNTVLLTDWIIETYPAETLETITRALTKPQTIGKTWRLTPDTISEWMTAEIERDAKQREVELSRSKQDTEVVNEWTEERLNELKELIDKAPGFKRGPALSPQEVREEGGEQPKPKAKFKPTTPEEALVKALHIEWIKQCYDPLTGKPNANWISEDEYLKLQE